MASGASSAQQAIFEMIEKTAKDARLEEYYVEQRAEILKGLALAYRYAAGGPQPSGPSA